MRGREGRDGTACRHGGRRWRPVERWRRSSAARVCIGHAHLRESCARPCAHGMESRQALSMWEAGRAVAKENLARVCVVGVRGRGQWEARARTSNASWGAQHQATCRMVLAMCTFVRRECVRHGKNRAWGGGAPRGLWCTTPCASRRTAPARTPGGHARAARCKARGAWQLDSARGAGPALRRKWNTSIRRLNMASKFK